MTGQRTQQVSGFLRQRKLLFRGYIPNPVSTIVTSETFQRRIIHARVCNTDPSTDFFFNLRIFPQSGSGNNAYMVYNEKTIAAKSTILLSELVGEIIDVGEALEVVANTTDKLSLHICAEL